MPQRDLSVALRHLCRAACVFPDSEFTDCQRLERFAADHEEAAFAALARRHGAAVLGRAMAVIRFSAVAVLTLVLCGFVGAGFVALAVPGQPEERAGAAAGREQSRAADAGQVVAAATDGEALPTGAFARIGSDRLRIGYGSIAAVTSDGKTLVALSRGGALHTFDTATGRELTRRTLGDRDRMLVAGYGSCLSDDGSTVALMEQNLSGGGLTVWDVRTGRRILRLEKVTRCALSREGKSLAVTREVGDFKYGFRVYDLPSGRPRDVPVPPDGYHNEYRFTPDGKKIITRSFPFGGEQRRLTAYDLASGLKLWQVAPADAFGFSADGRTVFTCSLDTPDTLRAVTVDTGIPVKGLKLPAHYEVRSRPVGLPDGRGLLVPLASGEVAVWDCRERRELRRLRASSTFWSDREPVASADGKNVYALADGLHGWRIDTGEVLFRPPEETGHSLAVAAVTFLPGGKELVSIDGDRTLLRWSLATGRRVGEPHRKVGFEARATSAGLLAGTGYVSSLAIRNVSSGELAGRVTYPDLRSSSEFVQFGLLADGRTALTYFPRPGKHVVAATDFVAGKTLYEVDVPPPPPSSAFPKFQGFSPCGRRFAAYGQVFSARTAKKQWTPTVAGRDVELKMMLPATFFADGRLLCGVLQKKGQPNTRAGFAVWETASGSVVLHSEFLFSRGFAVGPDGRTLAHLTGRGIRFVDLSTGRIVAEYDAPDVTDNWHEGFTTKNFVFAPDGKTLATGQNDGTVLLWKVPELPAAKLAEADWPGAWAALAGTDAAKAVYAADRMARQPAEAVAFLSAKYRARLGVEVAALIRDLDDEEFDRREQASGKLRELGFLAEPAMRNALKTASPEVKQRLDDLLERLGGADGAPTRGEGLRDLRTVAILERVGTAEAVTLLREWAGQAVDSPLRADSRLALERLSLR
jgi:hypothetical protein